MTKEERSVVSERLELKSTSQKRLQVPRGGTILVTYTALVPSNRLPGSTLDYEPSVTGILTANGLGVHTRGDRLLISRVGRQTKIEFTYAIFAEPNARSGGTVQGEMVIIERKGLGNSVFRKKFTHKVKLSRENPSPQDLMADFRGYHYYRARAVKRMAALKRAGLSGLSMADNSAMPPMNKVSTKGMQQVFAFERERRRMWIAHRHLVTASKHPDSQVSGAANIYLSNLGRSQSKWKKLPKVSLLEKEETSSPPPPPPPSDGKDEVVRLKPVGKSDVGASGSGSTGSDSGRLKPVASYDVDSEDRTSALPQARPRPKKKKPEPKPKAVAKESVPATEEDDTNVTISEDPFSRRVSKYIPLPNYHRGLVLEDPNIGWGGAIRFVWATVSKQEEAITPAFFYSAQGSITRDLGFEVTVPTHYVDADVERAESVYRMGNPMVAAKYRLFLPKVEGKEPVLTIKGRWGIAATPLNKLPPSDLIAEEFSQSPYVVDNNAFFLEKTDLGLGVNLAWQWNYIHVGMQFFADYLFPVEVAIDRSSFYTLGYGASVGAAPWGDIVAFYLEAKALSLLGGPMRTEFFGYVGARGKFLDYLEPAIWAGLPVGSVNNVTGPQFGIELRFSYDIQAVIDLGVRNREALSE